MATFDDVIKSLRGCGVQCTESAYADGTPSGIYTLSASGIELGRLYNDDDTVMFVGVVQGTEAFQVISDEAATRINGYVRSVLPLLIERAEYVAFNLRALQERLK